MRQHGAGRVRDNAYEAEALLVPMAVGEVSRWAAFSACLLSAFMLTLDTTIVNVAVPSLSHDLGISSSTQILVVSGYSLACGCTLLTTARLGEIFGRRRIFLLALMSFAVTSACCGLAVTGVELVIARGAQGVAGAAMSAQTIAIITALFPGHLRAKVFAWHLAAAGMGGMLGPVLGAILIWSQPYGLGWRWVFLINLPLSLFAFALAWRHLRVTGSSSPRSLDVVGVMLSTLGLLVLLHALVREQNNESGVGLISELAVTAALLTAFTAWEMQLNRRGRSPLLPLTLFSHRNFLVGVVLIAGFFAVFAALLFVIAVTTQSDMGYSAPRTTALTMPFALGAGVGALASPTLTGRLRTRAPAIGIMLFGVLLGAFALYLHVVGTKIDLALLLVPIAISGAGFGSFAAPLQPLLLAGLGTDDIAAASAVVPSVEQLGSSLGLATVSALFFQSHTVDAAATTFAALAAGSVVLAAVTLAIRPDDGDTTG